MTESVTGFRRSRHGRQRLPQVWQALGGWKARNFAAKITANEDSGSYS